MKAPGLAVLFIVMVFIQVIYPQRDVAIPFLDFPVSPDQVSMGGSGASIPLEDPYSFLVNPAQLGYMSQDNNLLIMLPSESLIYPTLNNVKLKNFGFNAGYNFKKPLGVPVSLGFGYARPEMNYGTYKKLSGAEIESKDYFVAWSVGAGIDYYLFFSAGITFKNITSNQFEKRKIEINAIDYGFMLGIPVIKLIDKNFSFNLSQSVSAKPVLDITLGYAVLNTGVDKVYYDFVSYAPLSRIFSTGYGISAGLDLIKGIINLKAAEISFTVDAEDILYERYYYDLKYQDPPGDVDYGKNVLGIKGDEKVVSHAGLRISFAETFIFKNGHFTGRYYNMEKTDGIEIRAKGLLKLLGGLTDNSALKYITDHIDLRYYKSTYYSNQPYERNFNNVALVINGFEF